MATEFHTFDAQGHDLVIPAGVAFTTWWVMQDGLPVALQLNHPWNALDHYGADDLARYRISAVEVADPPPPVVRPELPKSTVHARLVDIDKLDTVFSVLMASPQAFAEWFSPDWPNVYCDDERALGLLQAAGLTPDQISQVMAPPA